MNIDECFIEMVSEWDRQHKIEMLKQYGELKYINIRSNRKLNEEVARILILNINQADVKKILDM